VAIGYACGDAPHVNSSVVARDKFSTVPYTGQQRVAIPRRPRQVRRDLIGGASRTPLLDV
jgi:hypothetical protein